MSLPLSLNMSARFAVATGAGGKRDFDVAGQQAIA
jgi:hypothetical protein